MMTKRLMDIHFAEMMQVTKKCITYKADGNTVVQPYKKLYSMEQITGIHSLKNLFLEPVANSWWTEYSIWEDFGSVCYCIAKSQEEVPIHLVVKRLLEYGIGKENYKKHLAEAEASESFIRRIDVVLLTMLGEYELAEHYKEYREVYKERMERKEEEERRNLIEKERKEQEEASGREAEILNQAIHDLREKHSVRNVEINGKSLFLLLSKKYGIKIPLRTQGWIKSKLVMVYFEDEKAGYRYKESNSKVFMKYLDELMLAINEQEA